MREKVFLFFSLFVFPPSFSPLFFSLSLLLTPFHFAPFFLSLEAHSFSDPTATPKPKQLRDRVEQPGRRERKTLRVGRGRKGVCGDAGPGPGQRRRAVAGRGREGQGRCELFVVLVEGEKRRERSVFFSISIFGFVSSFTFLNQRLTRKQSLFRRLSFFIPSSSSSPKNTVKQGSGGER